MQEADLQDNGNPLLAAAVKAAPTTLPVIAALAWDLFKPLLNKKLEQVLGMEQANQMEAAFNGFVSELQRLDRRVADLESKVTRLI